MKIIELLKQTIAIYQIVEFFKASDRNDSIINPYLTQEQIDKYYESKITKKIKKKI